MELTRRRSTKDDGATLDELREAVATLEETERTARRVFGGAHPTTVGIENELQEARELLRSARPHSGSKWVIESNAVGARITGRLARSSSCGGGKDSTPRTRSSWMRDV